MSSSCLAPSRLGRPPASPYIAPRSSALLLLALLCASPLSLALSKPARAAPDAARRARAAFERGRRLFSRGEHRKALEAFRRAHRLKPHYRALCSMARCQQLLGRHVEAVALYRRCLADGGANNTGLASQARRALRRARAHIAHVTVRVSGSADSEGGGPAGDLVLFVDGKRRGEPPLELELDPGRRVFELRRGTVVASRRELALTDGEQRTLTFAPVAAAPPPPPAAGQPREALTRPERSSDRPETSESGLHPAWFWSAVGLTAAATAAAATMGALTLSKQSAFDETPTQPNADAFNDFRLTTNVMWGVVGAAAATAVVLYFFTRFSRSSDDRTGQQARWLLTPTGAAGVF